MAQKRPPLTKRDKIMISVGSFLLLPGLAGFVILIIGSVKHNTSFMFIGGGIMGGIIILAPIIGYILRRILGYNESDIYRNYDDR